MDRSIEASENGWMRVTTDKDSLSTRRQIRAFLEHKPVSEEAGWVVGKAVIVGAMSWLPILWDQEEDPTFVKESCVSVE